MKDRDSRSSLDIVPLFNLLLLGIFLLAGLSGCATPATEAIRRGDNMLTTRNYYGASQEYLTALDFESNNSDAKTKLCQSARQSYDQKLEMATTYEKTADFESALPQYQDLAQFIDRITPHNCLNFAPVNAKQKIAEMKSGASAQFYNDGEKLFLKSDYIHAIKNYQDALRHNNPYKDCKEKIAESHYQIGAKAESQKNFRNAADSYVSANETVSGYKDASEKAVSIYYSLGISFLKQKMCRNAYDDLSKAGKLNDNFKELTDKLAEAEACSVSKIAFMRFDNPTGRDISGMSIGDFIFDEIKTKLQNKASKFVRTMDREELQGVLGEQKLGLAGVTDDYASFKQLKGVDYLIFGQLTQVKMDAPPEKVERMKTPATQSYPCVKTDKKGRQYESSCNREINLTYERHTAKLNVALAGSIKAVSVSSGEQLIMQSISSKRNDDITYANINSDFNSDTDIPREIESLADARRELHDPDSLIKEIISEISDDMVKKILARIDQTKTVADPTDLKIIR